MTTRTLLRRGFTGAFRHIGVPVDAAALAALAVFVAWLLLPVYEQRSNLPGYDQYYHMAHLDYLTGQVERGSLPTLSPMFGGFRFFMNTEATYPSGVYFINLPIRMLTGDATTTYLWSLFLIFFFAAGGFYLGFKSRFGRVPALIGAAVVVGGPFQLTSIVPHGRWASLQAFAFMPAFTASSISFLERPSRFRFCVITGSFALMLASHPMVAYIATFGVAVYALTWSVWTGTPVRRLASAVAAIATGTLIAWVLVPSGLFDRLLPQAAGEVFAAPAGIFVDSGGPAGEGGAFSIGTWSFSSAYRGQFENYAGFAPLWLTVIIPVLQPRLRILATAGVVAVLYLVAFGNDGRILGALPLSNVLEPRRFLHAVYLFQGILLADAASYWMTGAGRTLPFLVARGRSLLGFGQDPAARLVRGPSRAMAASLVLAVPGLLLLGVLWNREVVPMRDTLYTYAARAIVPADGLRSEVPLLKRLAGDGRYMAQGKTDYAEFYFAYGAAGLDVLRDTEAVYAATLMNVRVVDTDAGRRPQEVEKFHQLGFQEDRRGAGGFTVLMHSDRPAVRLQVPSIRVLHIGSGPDPTGRRSVSGGVDVSRVDPEMLTAFDAVVLSGYLASEPGAARSMLDDFMHRGGVVVIGDPRRDGADLWRAVPEYRAIPSRAFVVGPTGSGVVELVRPDAIGAFFPDFGVPALPATDPASTRFDLIREQQVGDGYLVRTCCSLGLQLADEDPSLLAEAVEDYFEKRIGKDSIWPEPFPATVESFETQQVRFSYASARPAAVVISKPFDPRWKLMIDGREIPTHPYSGVILASLPRGSHTASLEYAVEPVPASAAFFTVGGLVALAVALGPLFAFMRGYGRTLPEFMSLASRWAFERRSDARPAGPSLIVEARQPTRLNAILYDGVAMDGVPQRFLIAPAAISNSLLVVPVTVINEDAATQTIRIGRRWATATVLAGERFHALDTVAHSKPAKGASGHGEPTPFVPLWGRVVLEPGALVRGELVFELPPGCDAVELRVAPAPGSVVSRFRLRLTGQNDPQTATR